MKISKISVWQVDLPLHEGDYKWSGGKSVETFDTTVVGVETDEGVTGYGEACPLGPVYLPSYAGGVRAGIRELGPSLLGENPLHLEKLNQHNNYITDPHSAIGYLGLKKYIQENNLNNCNGLFVSTAHPIKFKDTVENSIKSQLEYPDSIKSIMDREKSAKTIKSYSELKEYLMHKD